MVGGFKAMYQQIWSWL